MCSHDKALTFPSFSPTGFEDDGNTIFVKDVTREDKGYTGPQSDWFQLCKLDELFDSATDIPFVGLFVDKSSSMYLSSVMTSYGNFKTSVKGENSVPACVVSSYENWIEPFMEDLTKDAAINFPCE